MKKINLKGSVNFIVKPNSTKNEIVGYDESKDAYRINIKAKAEGGKANLELIKFLTKLSGKNVRILKGKSSKLKVLKFF